MEAYNIASTTLPTHHISTAMIPRVITEVGEFETYETIVWEWDPNTKTVGRMVDKIDHHWEWEARQKHLRIAERYLMGEES